MDVKYKMPNFTSSFMTREELHTEYHDYIDNSLEYRLEMGIRTFLPPIFVALGILPNLITMATLRTQRLRQSTTCFYLFVYTLFNTITLLIGCGLPWLFMVLETPYIGELLCDMNSMNKGKVAKMKPDACSNN